MGNGKLKDLSIFDLGANISNLSPEQLAKTIQTGIMPVNPTPQHIKNAGFYNSGVDPIDANLDGIRLEMARLEFTTKMNELATFGTISKKRYFEIKKLYESKDVESANMASKILDGLHEKMLKE
jgi:hypothetical protein